MRKTILIYLDAGRSDYISAERMPFLHRLANDNVWIKQLRPGFGFCERTEILTGISADKSGFFGALSLDSKKSPYRTYVPFLRVLDKVERFLKSRLFSRVLRRLLWWLVRNQAGGFYPFRIPLKVLGNFALTEDGPGNPIEHSASSAHLMLGPVFLGGSTSLAMKASGTDQDRINVVEKALSEEYSFYPLYISELDRVGHLLGPTGDGMDSALLEVDKMLEDFYNRVLRIQPDVRFVVCGDHGMTEVQDVFNVLPTIELLQEECDEQFSFFIDSTAVRFWIDNPTDKERVIEKMSAPEFPGRIYNDPNILCDVIWICDNGVVINPDFFNDKTVKGMHGYLPRGVEHNGFLIAVDGNKYSFELSELTSVHKYLISGIV